MLKLVLKSDFTDGFLDAFFDNPYGGGEFSIYNRYSKFGPSRPMMFDFFHKNQMKTPLFGKYNDFLDQKYDDTRQVVVYNDINSHCGENKEIVKFNKLSPTQKGCYLCEFIPSQQTIFSNYKSISTRHLFIGRYSFAYNYYSTDDWRSNYGDGWISEPIQLDTPDWRNSFNRAMFAIDYVGPLHELLAVDLNISPGTYGVKLGKFLKNKEIVDEIKWWVGKYGTDEWSQYE